MFSYLIDHPLTRILPIENHLRAPTFQNNFYPYVSSFAIRFDSTSIFRIPIASISTVATTPTITTTTQQHPRRALTTQFYHLTTSHVAFAIAATTTFWSTLSILEIRSRNF
jgi:hypothetical protein